MTKYNKIVLASLVLALATSGLAAEASTGAADNYAGLRAIGAGLALGLVGAVAEDPSKAGSLLLYFLIPETLVIFGFLALFILR